MDENAEGRSVIIFDLYGTLVGGYSYSQHERAVAAMAEVTRAGDHAVFARRFSYDTWVARGTGQFPGVAENIAWIFEQEGWPLDAQALVEASRLRMDFMATGLEPLPGAPEALATLRGRGYRLGLISDCSSETVELWPELPFAPLIEEPVFSCAVGYLKPHPRIYEIACERLAVAPEACVYVGDRPEEVIGARAAGMWALRVRPVHNDTYEAREEGRPTWDGPEIDAVAELPAILDGGRLV